MLKRLTLGMIESSPEIQDWLGQFPMHKRLAATALLTQLRFVSRDEYAEWLKKTLSRIPCATCGLFAVRKLKDMVVCLWNHRGVTLPRPATSLGSEDLVQSVIAGMRRSNEYRYQDHPSLALVKKSKSFHAVLIDDSSGSGDRIRSFVRRVFSSRTFMSRWSFGWVHLHIVIYARSIESEKLIMESIPGSDHGLRIFPKQSKVSFHGKLAYHVFDLRSRWGKHAIQIQDLCDSMTQIPANRRRGYGKTMSNIVFFHSVPNNIPGVLFCQNRKWNALFPGRTIPQWLPHLLDGHPTKKQDTPAARVPDNLVSMLLLIKSGRRKELALSRSMGFDLAVLRVLLERARNAGFINDDNRLTDAGLRTIWANTENSEGTPFDFSLYIPTKWCAGRTTVQPSGLGGETRWEKTESARGMLREDGGVGQAPLERTDAMTASPSLGVTTQGPSMPREGGDSHGPLG